MTRFALLLAAAVMIADPASATLRQFSYDPANDATREAAGDVTLLIDQHLFSTRVLKLRATDAKATTDLKRVDAGDLPRGGLSAALGPEGRGRDLYRILDADQGPELTAALCPGSARAWLALTPVRYGEGVQVILIGDDPKGGPARRCRVLDFQFHGEWRLPAHAPPPMERDEPPAFPN